MAFYTIYNLVYLNYQVLYNIKMDKEQLLKRFGKNVKIERIRQDLKQADVAERLGIEQNYIALIEIGRINMSLGKILELANAIGVHIEDLLKFK